MRTTSRARSRLPSPSAASHGRVSVSSRWPPVVPTNCPSPSLRSTSRSALSAIRQSRHTRQDCQHSKRRREGNGVPSSAIGRDSSSRSSSSGTSSSSAEALNEPLRGRVRWSAPVFRNDAREECKTRRMDKPVLSNASWPLIAACTLVCGACGSQTPPKATPIVSSVVTLHVGSRRQVAEVQLPAHSRVNCVNHNQRAIWKVSARSTWKAGVAYGWFSSTASGEFEGKRYSATLMVHPERQGSVLAVRCTH